MSERKKSSLKLDFLAPFSFLLPFGELCKGVKTPNSCISDLREPDPISPASRSDSHFLVELSMNLVSLIQDHVKCPLAFSLSNNSARMRYHKKYGYFY